MRPKYMLTIRMKNIHLRIFIQQGMTPMSEKRETLSHA